MFPPRLFPLFLPILLLPSLRGTASAQDPVDALPDSTSADSVAADTIPVSRAVTDPRVTLLGDTLATADTTRPHFAELPEIYPDSLVNPYRVARPGAWAEWELTGDQFLGRGAQSLLDVLESEALLLGQDLGGSGLPVFAGSPHGSHTNIQVSVDGVPLGGPLAVGWDLRQIPIEAIARVAWYPGPQVAAWGGMGTGGVLEITTRRSLAPAARSLLALGAGSFDAESFGGYFGRPVTEDGDVFAAVNFDASDGLLSTGDFTRNQLVAKAGWQLGSRHRIEVSRLSDGFSGEVNRTNLAGSQDQDAVTLHGFYAGSAGPLTARVHTYRSSEDIGENFLYRETPGLFGEGERTGARGEVDLGRGPLMGWVRAAWERAEVTSTHAAFLRADGSSILEPPPVGEEDAGTLVNPRRQTELGGGVGYGHPGGRVAANLAVTRIDHGAAAEAGTAWQAEGLARPLAHLTLRAAAGRGSRPASPLGQAILANLAADGVEIHPGRPTDPQALEQWTGWRGQAAWSDAGWRVEAGAFGADGEGAFLWLPPTAWLYFDRGSLQVVRLGEPGFNTFDVLDLSVRGLEGEIVFPLPWDLRGVLRMQGLDVTDDLSGDRVPYIPRVQALGQLRYARRFFPSRDLLVEARLIGRYSGPRTTLGGEELAAYLLGDVLLQATVINFTLYISLKNVAGQSVRAEEGFFLPQREGFIGINWRFRN